MNAGGPNFTFLVFGATSFLLYFYCRYVVRDTTTAKKSMFFELGEGEEDVDIHLNEKQRKMLYMPKQYRVLKLANKKVCNEQK